MLGDQEYSPKIRLVHLGTLSFETGMFKNAVLKATLRIIQWWIFSLFSLKIE